MTGRPARRKTRRRIIGALLLCIAVAALPRKAPAKPDPGDGRAAEYELKAAYLYNFLHFVLNWDTVHSNTNTLRIGIMPPHPFDRAFDPVEGLPTGETERILEIVRLKVDPPSEDLASCHIVFFPRGSEREVEKVIQQLKDQPVLTVGETRHFLTNGGMLQFERLGNKVRWAVNRNAVEQARLQLSSQIYRSALRVLYAKDSDP
jgi:hypothetical protein